MSMETFSEICKRALAGEPVHGDVNVRNQPMYLDCQEHGKWRWRDTMDGPVLSADCPACIEDRRLSGLLDGAAIPPRYRSHSLDTFKASEPDQHKALSVCRGYVADIERTIRTGANLVFIGSVGTGKTHLACGIARAFLNAGFTAKYIRVADLISLVRETWRPDSKHSERKVYRDLCAVDLLILDEVGVQAGTENEQQILFNVINKRNEEMRPLILLSNLTVPQIKSVLGERSHDRIHENGKTVQFVWESYRRVT